MGRSTPVTKDTTLYAHWTKNDTPARGTLTRLAGDTRYQTMGRIVSTAFPRHSDTVVVASGDNFPDALSASSLAGGLNAPIILTPRPSTPASTTTSTKPSAKTRNPSPARSSSAAKTPSPPPQPTH